MSESSSSKNLLPDSIKLKEEENYIIKKKVIEDITVVNKLRYYIYIKRKAPEYINKFNKKANNKTSSIADIRS